MIFSLLSLQTQKIWKWIEPFPPNWSARLTKHCFRTMWWHGCRISIFFKWGQCSLKIFSKLTPSLSPWFISFLWVAYVFSIKELISFSGSVHEMTISFPGRGKNGSVRRDENFRTLKKIGSIVVQNSTNALKNSTRPSLLKTHSEGVTKAKFLYLLVPFPNDYWILQRVWSNLLYSMDYSQKINIFLFYFFIFFVNSDIFKWFRENSKKKVRNFAKISHFAVFGKITYLAYSRTIFWSWLGSRRLVMCVFEHC